MLCIRAGVQRTPGQKPYVAKPGVSPVPQATAGSCLFHKSINIRSCGSRDEPPMTACGGNLIGGEIKRNEQCPHEADLRRLSLRTLAALAGGRSARKTCPLACFQRGRSGRPRKGQSPTVPLAAACDRNLMSPSHTSVHPSAGIQRMPGMRDTSASEMTPSRASAAQTLNSIRWPTLSESHRKYRFLLWRSIRRRSLVSSSE